MAKVSVLIPSRNERFLVPTVQDVLSKARGDVEVLVCLEGYWPVPTLPNDKRVRVWHHGTARGMRPAINEMTRLAYGDYFMKLDAHCMLAEGFDVELQKECADNWIVVPRRYALEPEHWVIDESNPKYPIDYHYLSFPWEAGVAPEKAGMHGTEWRQRKRARAAIDFDDEMSSQGSCWFMTRTHWDRLGPMEIKNYGNFIHEFQELGMKTWLGGGAVKVNKRTWYAHLYKGVKYGRGYTMGPNGHKDAMVWCVNHWMFNRWQERTRDLSWLVDKFTETVNGKPQLPPGWPADWQEQVEKRRRGDGYAR